ncbi:hypothetical protein O988_09444, partial [Pseudogymnoascus sp. VKM F-3808]
MDFFRAVDVLRADRVGDARHSFQYQSHGFRRGKMRAGFGGGEVELREDCGDVGGEVGGYGGVVEEDGGAGVGEGVDLE